MTAQCSFASMCTLTVLALCAKPNNFGKYCRYNLKIQPLVDWGFRPVSACFCCSKQWQLPGNGWNCWLERLLNQVAGFQCVANYALYRIHGKNKPRLIKKQRAKPDSCRQGGAEGRFLISVGGSRALKLKLEGFH